MHRIHVSVLTVLTHKLLYYREAFFSLWLSLQFILYYKALFLHLSLLLGTFFWGLEKCCIYSEDEEETSEKIE